MHLFSKTPVSRSNVQNPSSSVAVTSFKSLCTRLAIPWTTHPGSVPLPKLSFHHYRRSKTNTGKQVS